MDFRNLLPLRGSSGLEPDSLSLVNIEYQFKNVKVNFRQLWYIFNMYKGLILLICTFALSGNAFAQSLGGICGRKIQQKKFLKIQNKYATGYSIKRYKGFYLLTIKKTWDKASKPQHIFLVENSLFFPSTCQNYFNIKIPVKKVASLSTTHLPAIDLLGELKTVAAFSNLKFAFNEEIKKSEKAGEVFELGSPPSSERLLALKPDVIFSYATTDPKVEGLGSLISLKLPLVFISEFREKHPLARAEWIKVFGVIYNKLDLAKKKFREIEAKYNEVTEVALQTRPKKRVLIGELSKGVWKAPGGASDLITLITDAGGEYLWSNDKSESTININVEKVLVDSAVAEVWLPHNMSLTKSDLLKNELYKKLNITENISIYNNVSRLTESGGNDYWETALMRPDLLIQDLLKVFHPILIPGHDLIWYKQLD